MISYEQLISYGNVIQLSVKCNVPKMMDEIRAFPFRQYNTHDYTNPRQGLSITSADGSIDGAALESTSKMAAKNDTAYTEMDFRTLTDVYYKSGEVRRVVDPFKPYMGRSHFLKFSPGGYFPPHRDSQGVSNAFRIIIPLSNCSPPWSYFILDEKIIHFQEGYAYFINTNLQHCFFNFAKEAMMIIMNIESTPEAHVSVLRNALKQ